MEALYDGGPPPPIPPRSPLRDVIYMDRAISIMAPITPQTSSDGCAVVSCSSTDWFDGNVKPLRSPLARHPSASTFPACKESTRSHISARLEKSTSSLDDTQLMKLNLHHPHATVRDAHDTGLDTALTTSTSPPAIWRVSTSTSPASSVTSEGSQDWPSSLLAKQDDKRCIDSDSPSESITTDSIFDMIDQLPNVTRSGRQDLGWFSISTTPLASIPSMNMKPRSTLPP